MNKNKIHEKIGDVIDELHKLGFVEDDETLSMIMTFSNVKYIKIAFGNSFYKIYNLFLGTSGSYDNLNWDTKLIKYVKDWIIENAE